jgi:hypothetical protein
MSNQYFRIFNWVNLIVFFYGWCFDCHLLAFAGGGLMAVIIMDLLGECFKALSWSKETAK